MNTGPLNENELEWLDETLAKYKTGQAKGKNTLFH